MNVIRFSVLTMLFLCVRSFSAEALASLTIEIPKEINAGALIPVVLTVKNNSKSVELSYQEGSGVQSFDFVVEELLSDGRFKSISKTSANRAPNGGNVLFLKLIPQNEIVSKSELSRLFDFSYPGKYRVIASTSLSLPRAGEKGASSVRELNIQSEPYIVEIKANKFIESVKTTDGVDQGGGAPQLSISSERHNVKQGDLAMLVVTVRNGGKETISFSGLKCFQNYLYKITRDGEIANGILSSNIVAVKSRFFTKFKSEYTNNSVSLAAGKSISIEVPLNLCFDMHCSEIYFVQVFKSSLDDNGVPFELFSNVLKIRMCDNESEVKFRDEEQLIKKHQ